MSFVFFFFFFNLKSAKENQYHDKFRWLKIRVPKRKPEYTLAIVSLASFALRQGNDYLENLKFITFIYLFIIIFITIYCVSFSFHCLLLHLIVAESGKGPLRNVIGNGKCNFQAYVETLTQNWYKIYTLKLILNSQ